MSSAGRNSAVLGGTGTTPTAANNVSSSSRKSPDGYRRPSQEGSSMFAGLTHQKRGSQDSTAAARRASFADQAPPAGFIGSMWNKFTRGEIDVEKK